MVEQSHPGEAQHHAVAVAGLDHRVVPDGAAGLGHVGHAAAEGPLDVVGEGEEGVAAQGHAPDRIQIRPLLLPGEGFGPAGEVPLPDPLGADVLFILVDIAVDDVVPVRPAQIRAEGQVQHLRGLPQEPGVRLGARQPGAMDPGLLSRSHADGLAVIGEADGVGLGVFQGDQGHQQIPGRRFRQILVLGDDVMQQVPVDLEVVPALLKGDAEDLLPFLHRGHIGRVDADHVVAALALGFQDLQGLRGIARGDDAVGDLPLDEAGGEGVAGIGEGHPVAEGAHPVGAPGSGVGAGQGILVQPRDVVHKAGPLQRLRQGQTQSAAGGAHMLKGGGRRKPGGFLQLLDKLPGVQSVQKIDVAGAAVEDLHREVGTVRHKDPGGLLVRVAAVFQFKFLHRASCWFLLISRSSVQPVFSSTVRT